MSKQTVQVELELAVEEDTVRLGAALVELCPPRGVISLNGPLGAGKTRLVRAVAEAVGAPSVDVGSPTFVVCRTYRGKRVIHHLDLYRVADEDEFWELGTDELFETESLSWIEWGERMGECLPPDRLVVTIRVTGPESRLAVLTAGHASWSEVLTQLPEEFRRLKQ